MSYTYKVPRVYNHTQATASATWDIQVPFPGIPVIDVLVDNGTGELTKMIPKTTTRITPTHIQLVFTKPFSGQARVVA